jgi:DUF4097 and DUF4098 domain-containing protein YvlB
MKNKWIIASILIVALIVLCGASLFAVWTGVRLAQKNGLRINLATNTVSAQTTETKSLNVSGPADLTVQNDFGEISILSGPDGQVSVKAEKTAWGSSTADAQTALKDLKVIYDQNGDVIKISVEYPMDVNTLQLNIDHNPGNIKFTITVPKASSVSLNSSTSDLSLDGTSGTASLKTDFGAISLNNVSAEIFAKSNNGTVTAKNIGVAGHKLTLSSEFGDISLTGAIGSDVIASSNNGSTDLSGIQASGLLKVTSQFGGIHVSDSQAGSAEFRSDNGPVRLEKIDLSGALTIKSDFGDLTLAQVMASSYDLNSANGKIEVAGAQGPIKAYSQFGEVKVLNAKNAILDLSSNNGGITFSGSLGDGPHSLKSEFGNISLNLPADLKANVDMQTELGKISSDFDITVSAGKSDEKHLTGKINGGGAQLTVRNNNGNITLQISK